MTRTAVLVALLSCACGTCEINDGRMYGNDICVIHDDGGVPTTEAEFVTMIGLIDDTIGTKKKAIEDRWEVLTGIEHGTIACGSLAPSGECFGLYDGTMVFARFSGATCFADTAFAHEWAHHLMNMRGDDYWEHPDLWFGPDGVVAVANMEYTLLFCPEKFE